MTVSILALPGMACDARVYDPQAAALADQADFVAAPALTGATAEDQAAEALALADARGWSRFGLIGFSMGGLAAAALAERAPGRVAGLALIGAQVGACRPERKALIETELELLRRGERAEHAADFAAYAGLYPEPARTVVLAMFADQSDAVLIAQKQAIAARPDRTSVIARFRGPLSIIYGARDVMISAAEKAAMREVGARAGGAYLELNRCGHYATLEAPESVNAALSDWAKSTAQMIRDDSVEA